MTATNTGPENASRIPRRRIVLAACLLAGAITWRAGGSEPAAAYAKASGPGPTPRLRRPRRLHACRRRHDDLAKQAYQILKTQLLRVSRRAEALRPRHADARVDHGRRRERQGHRPARARRRAGCISTRRTSGDMKMPPPPNEKISTTTISRRCTAWIAAGGSLEGVEEAAAPRRIAEELLKSEERPIKPAEREYWAFKTPRRARRSRRRRRRAGTRTRSTRSSRRRWKPRA